MQFLRIEPTTKLKEVGDRVGYDNVDRVLALNSMKRAPEIGSQLEKNVSFARTDELVNWHRKSSILNTMVGDSDVFEDAALMNDDDWKVYQRYETFPGCLRIPSSITLPLASDVIGNNIPIGNTVYKAVMQDLTVEPHIINPKHFTQYSTSKGSVMREYTPSAPGSGWNVFPIPWGEVSVYSSISGEMVDIPCYPLDVSNDRIANYATMPDLIYQYEPWVVYQSSGPRSCTYKFELHRDMWSGDHHDGKCNDLIRFLESNCYPQYNGSAVNTATVTLYVHGQTLISGIMTRVSTSWSGPIGDDNFYLYCELTITIQEVSETALSYDSVRQKSLIG